MLLGDRPISSESDDILGFAQFADALAKSLTEMAPDEGIVISLEGPWGTGKTSAIQLTERRLLVRELAREKDIPIETLANRNWPEIQKEWDDLIETRRTHVIRFNPWNFSGHENLVRAFFYEVGATLGGNGALANAAKRIADYLPAVGTFAGAAASLAAGAIPIASVAATAGRAAGEGAQRLLGTNQSLERAKHALAIQLRQSNKRIIVIIDDLDRLLPSEMRAMFSLVKSLGDLPNVLYVLSFDREVVSSVLSIGPEPIESHFLEKIVQVQLRLPPPWKAEVRTLLFKRIDEIVGDVAPNDQNRWRLAFYRTIDPYINSPRDVVRFRNTLQVIWPNIAGDVDLTDLMILTTLQLFEPTVYHQILGSIEELSGEASSWENDADFASKFEPCEARDAETSKQALASLFPRLGRGWKIHSWDGSSYLKMREHRRLCTSEYYRNYFLFGIDPDRLSRAQLLSLLQSNDVSQRLAQIIQQLSLQGSRKGTSRVALLLDQIFELVFSFPLLTADLVIALLDLSDELIVRRDLVWDFFATENLERLNFILTAGLTPLSQQERIDRIQRLVEHDRGITLAAVTIDRLAGQHGLFGSEALSESERCLPREAVEGAATKVLQKIRQLAESQALLSVSKFSYILWIWRRWAGTLEVRTWLQREVRFDQSVVLLAELLPSSSFRSDSEGRREVRVFKASEYSDVMDVDAFKQRLEYVVARGSISGAEAIREQFLAAEAAASQR
jgi:predicted KAP-like P-loop ATPase